MSASHRDQVISSVRQTQKGPSAKPWAKIDLPIDRRTAESTLFALKRMLVDWGYSKKGVYVDKEECVLTVDGDEILKTEVENFVLKIRCLKGEWEQWEDLQSAPEFASLMGTAQGKLDSSKAFPIGGKGKKGKGE